MFSTARDGTIGYARQRRWQHWQRNSFVSASALAKRGFGATFQPEVLPPEVFAIVPASVRMRHFTFYRLWQKRFFRDGSMSLFLRSRSAKRFPAHRLRLIQPSSAINRPCSSPLATVLLSGARCSVSADMPSSRRPKTRQRR